MTITKKFGWKPDAPDFRDQKFGVHHGETGTVATESDLAKTIDWIYDQGDESSCVAHAAASMIRYFRKKKGFLEIDPSRNFIYWTGRALEHATNQDGGMVIRDVMKALADTGYCKEEIWAYSRATLFQQPTTNVFTAAKRNVIDKYVAIKQNHQDIRSALTQGMVIEFGISVYNSMMSEEVAHTGIVPMPDPSEKMEGGHAILLVGHNDHTRKYKFMNSWGDTWGDKGYGYLPYEYVENPDLASDFWTIVTFRTNTVTVTPTYPRWWDPSNWFK